jgi:hypothetical protein
MFTQIFGLKKNETSEQFVMHPTITVVIYTNHILFLFLKGQGN